MAQVNKVHSVQTIGLVARELGKSEDEIADLALGMDPEDGLIWVYSPEHEGGMMAFTVSGKNPPRGCGTAAAGLAM